MFTMDQQFQTYCLHWFLLTYNLGTGEDGKHVTSIEGNVLVHKIAGTTEVASTREFTDTGFVQTMYGKGVTATRTWKRA